MRCSFDDCVLAPSMSTIDTLTCTQAYTVEVGKNKEATMGHYYDDEDRLVYKTDKAATREYLSDRVFQVANDKEESLRKDFFLDDDDAPKTVTEMLQRIKDGKFIAPDPVVDQKLYDERPWEYRITRQLKWRDPSKPADRDGFEKATATLWNAVTDVKDTIMASEATDGLAALTAFKAQTFH